MGSPNLVIQTEELGGGKPAHVVPSSKQRRVKRLHLVRGRGRGRVRVRVRARVRVRVSLRV